MRNLKVRLTRLELPTQSGCIIMWKRQDETDEQVEARWKKEHPGEDLERRGLKVITVRWLAPQGTLG